MTPVGSSSAGRFARKRDRASETGAGVEPTVPSVIRPALIRLVSRVHPFLSLLGLVYLAALTLAPHGYDFHAYWTVNPADPYAVTSEYGAFRYAPPIALLFAPLGSLPLPVAHAAWLALQLAALWYVGRTWALALVLLPPVWLDLAYGNIYVLLGAMMVAGYRHPAVWSFGLLTKITPGIGLVWLAARREWRALAIATTAVMGLSVAIQGVGVWTDWIAMLLERNAYVPPDAWPLPFLPRAAAAIAILVWGARGNRRWTIPVAVVLAMPTLWLIALAPLVALAHPSSRKPHPRT